MSQTQQMPLPTPPKISHPNCKNDPEKCRIIMFAAMPEIIERQQAARVLYDGYGRSIQTSPIHRTMYDCETCGAKWTSHYDSNQKQVIESLKEPQS